MGGIELRSRWWYDAGDERVLGEEDGAIVVWVRDINGRLLTAFKTGEQPSQKSYVYVGDRLIGTTTGPDNHDHIHPDHLGTPRLMTDEDGERLAFHEYLPFGFEFTNPYQDDERKKFTGHERDYTSTPGTSFDLDYMHARHYSPSRHRFLSVDPIDGGPGRPQSWNRYAYVLNNPVNFVDPFGLAETECVRTGPGEIECTADAPVTIEIPIEWRIPGLSGRLRDPEPTEMQFDPVMQRVLEAAFIDPYVPCAESYLTRYNRSLDQTRNRARHLGIDVMIDPLIRVEAGDGSSTEDSVARWDLPRVQPGVSR